MFIKHKNVNTIFERRMFAFFVDEGGDCEFSCIDFSRLIPRNWL